MVTYTSVKTVDDLRSHATALVAVIIFEVKRFADAAVPIHTILSEEYVRSI